MVFEFEKEWFIINSQESIMQVIDWRHKVDYKEIKKGMKRKELDEINYNARILGSIVLGVVVGVISKNFVIGFVVFLTCGIFAARKYFEM
jgi:hypothetical protein